MEKMEGDTQKQPVAWFEFLFDSSGNLLKNHLKDTSAEPTASQLIVQFLERSKATATSNVFFQQSTENFPQGETKRSRRLKQLALQAAYHLKWNLETLEDNLSLQWQDVLFGHLLKTASTSFNNGDIDISCSDRQSVTALIIYHRWVIRTLAQHFLPNIGKLKNGMLEAVGNEAILKNLREQLSTSLVVLEKVLSLTDDLELPCPPEQHKEEQPQQSTASPSNISSGEATEGRTSPTEEERQQREGEEGRNNETLDQNGQVAVPKQNGIVEEVEKVSKEEIIAQVSFDLATLYFYQEKFEQAAKLFQHCKESKCTTSPFYSENENKLHGYHVACCGILGKSPVKLAPSVASSPTLLERVEKCQPSGYKDVIPLLLEDNRTLLLPMDFRQSLVAAVDGVHLDHSATGAGITLGWQIMACNTLRNVLEGKAAESAFWASMKNCTKEHIDCIFSYCVQSLTEEVSDTKNLARNPHFKTMKSFIHLLCGNIPEIDALALMQKSPANVFMKAKDDKDDKSKPPKEPFVFKYLERDSGPRGPEDELVDVKCGKLVHKLRLCFDPLEINAILQELHHLQPDRLVHNENFTCMLHKAFLDDVKDIELQDILHVLISKAIHCSLIKEFKLSINLLDFALARIDGLATPVIDRVRNVIHQERLVLELKLNCENGKNEDLSGRVKSYIWQTGKRPDLQPRVEKHTVAYLLNTKETAFLDSLMNEMEDISTTDYRLLGALLATTYSSITKPQGWRKPVRLLWDAVLRVFSTTVQQKRPQEGPGYQIRRDAANINMSGFMGFVKKIKDTSSLGLLISCLARLHNLSKEGKEGIREVFSSYTHLWPTSVTNRSSVNFDQIAATLTQVTQHATTVDPHNPSWLHTYADLHLDSQNFSAALKCYLEAGACSSLNFTITVPNSVWDDQVYKNMVCCCMNLKAHIQAALLCQCTDPVDYSTAFKAFQQATTVSEDAMDQHYKLFWDVTMLEYLTHTHAKRGQHDKKNLAMQAINQVDLNIHNSPDVLQHAHQTRRAALFRSLAKQYL